MKKILFLSILFAISLKFKAQEGSILDKQNAKLLTEILDILNAQLGGKCSLAVEDRMLVASFWENNAVYRTDRTYLQTLDPNGINYSDEEKAVIVKCKSEDQLTGKLKKYRGGCIERHIVKNNILRAYYRINFDVKGDRSQFISTFKLLLDGLEAKDVDE